MRTTAATCTGGPKPIAQVARELGVSYILEGSIRRGGGRTRVTAQLILAASDAHVWSEVYERPAPDPLAAEEEIARAVARGVAGTLRETAARPDPSVAWADSDSVSMTQDP
jgi:adenylate cyclase